MTFFAVALRMTFFLCPFIQLKIKPRELADFRRRMGTSRRQCILIANHTSYLDILLCVYATPLTKVGSAKMMVANHLFKMPVLAQILRAMGHLAVPFKNNTFKVDPEAVQKVQDQLEAHAKHGGLVGWFPEGQVNRKNPLKVDTFRKGGFKLPAHLDAEIWCLVFVGNSECWGAKANVGGKPARIGGTIFRLCESSHDLKESAKVNGANFSGGEEDQILNLANYAHQKIQYEVLALADEGYGRPEWNEEAKMDFRLIDA
jgi:1-acyl-sn-glycerol-3-phosphate acyltransferase